MLRATRRKPSGRAASDRGVRAAEAKGISALLAAALEHSADAVIVTDREGRIAWVNPSFENVTGYARAELEGLTPRILKSGAQTDDLYRALWTQLFSGKPWSGRFLNRRKNGTTYETDATISPIFAASGEIAGFIGIERDMTAHFALHDRIVRAEELTRTSKLVGGIAHEVRNPLNALQAALSALELDIGDDEENRTLFKALRTQVTRVAGLMREVVEYSRPVDGANVETCAVDTLCEEAIALWHSRDPERAARRVRFEPLGRDGFVDADATRIREAIGHLLENAHRHSGAALEITLRVKRGDGAFAIEVADEGSGIRPEQLPKVFDPFFTTRRGARGLGLTIVRNVVEQHGGRVAIMNNEPGPGCTAGITLAARSAAEELVHAGETTAR